MPICRQPSLPTPTTAAGVRFLHPFVCVSVGFPARYLKTDAARITKLDTSEIFKDESWKSVYFEVKSSKAKVGSQKQCRRGSLHSCECWLLLVSYSFTPLYKLMRTSSAFVVRSISVLCSCCIRYKHNKILENPH